MSFLKKYLIYTIIITAFLPILAKAEDKTENSAEAVVIKILEEKEITRENNSKVKQQNLELYILNGPLKNQTAIFYGISDIDVVELNYYEAGDRVIISYQDDENGERVFYVMDYVRKNALIWLTIISILIIAIIGTTKGLRALLSLALTFILIIKVMVPLMLKGMDPLIVGVAISFIILLFIIYLTEGFKNKSHIAILSIVFSLAFTAILSIIFTNIAKLTGTSSEEVAYLIGTAKASLDFKGLLLASIIIGTLGVLDDVVIGQIEAVKQIKEANNQLSNFQIFKMSMAIGKAHLGAIINTLFLAYVGASLPLVLLFSIHQPPFLTFDQIINHEEIATEIIRTLVGIIGLCSAVPISTFLSTKYKKYL